MVLRGTSRTDLLASARLLALGVAGARVALGVVALTRPELPARLWVADDDARRLAVQLLARALGGRDAALGAGAVVALVTGQSARSWVVAGALADTGDVVGTLAAWSHLPPVRRRVVVAVAGGAAVVGVLTAPLLAAGPAQQLERPARAGRVGPRLAACRTRAIGRR